MHSAVERFGVVEDRVGAGSTDFWSISFSPSGLEHEPMDDTEINRHSAFHTMDHAWEMADKDLTVPAG